jgi:dipeptidyl aminopeptidase/acylaminoacyl peptidase
MRANSFLSSHSCRIQISLRFPIRLFNIISILILFTFLESNSSDLPPIDSLFKTPRIDEPSLSLDGKYFVALYTENDQTSLLSFNLETKEVVRAGLPDGCDVYGYHWASNETIIYEMGRYKRFVDNVGVIRRDLTFPKMLIENKLVSIVSGLVHDSDNVLIWFRNNPDDNSPTEELRIVNISSGRYGKPQADFTGRVLEWTTDLYGVARFARVYRKSSDGKDDFYYRADASAAWRKVEFPKFESAEIYGFSPDGSKLYISLYCGKNTSSLCLYDIEKAQVYEEIYNDTGYDFDGTLRFLSNPHFNSNVKLRGVTNHGKSVWFDSSMALIQHDIDEKFKLTTNVILDADTSLTKFLIASYSDIQPTQYSLFDIRKREVFLIAEAMPWMHPDELCPTRRLSFITRDSLRLSGFLTYPKTGKPPYPTVVLLHGGPEARDEWEFNPEVQMLATRGYAVLQVNYRGSTGFGMKISQNSRFDYLEMHRDVSDATRKAIRSGIIDSNRVAIMGASFGGYLAICGAAFDPDLYSCAITNAGVFDWKYQWEHFEDYANSRFYDEIKQLVSSKSNVDEFFFNASPIHAASNIKIPVLIAGGRDDQRVPVVQSYRLARKMRKAGNRPETYFKIDETHGFHYEANRVRYYEKVLDFLNRNISKHE